MKRSRVFSRIARIIIIEYSVREGKSIIRIITSGGELFRERKTCGSGGGVWLTRRGCNDIAGYSVCVFNAFEVDEKLIVTSCNGIYNFIVIFMGIKVYQKQLENRLVYWLCCS